MKDAISLQRVQLLHPKVRQDFQNFIEEAENALNITIRITQGLRTFAEQQALWNIGHMTEGKVVTKAKPGQSYHQYGLAVDLVEVIPGNVDWNYDMSKLLPYSTKYGITWGGDFPGNFKDYPHFEKTLGHSWQDLLVKYNAKEFIEGTEYLNI